MARYPERRSASIPALWAVQRRYGWCTPEGIRQAAAVMGVTPAYLESVASFYDLFRTEPVGKHQVLVCTNISCWMRGGDELLDAFCEAAGAERDGTSEDRGSSSAASSAWAPATWRRWPRSTSATTGRSSRERRRDAIEQLRAGRRGSARQAARRPQAAAGGEAPATSPSRHPS